MFQKISRRHLMMSRVSALIGTGCLIVAIVGDVMDTVLGLETIYWLIIAVGFAVIGCWHILIGLAEAI